jgi:hypothetical protein
LGCAWLLAAASRADEPKRPAPDTGGPAQGVAESKDKDEPLASTQEMISRRFKRFEETLSKIHEALRRTDPERAELLLRAIGKSKEDRISQQMGDLVQLLRDNKQLGDAIERQGDVVTQLHALLDLLLSEDRQKELKEEQARIRKYLEELNKIIAREKGNRADNERGAPADDVADQQKKIAEQAGKLGKSIDKEDKARQNRSGSGDQENSSADESGNPKQGANGEKRGPKNETPNPPESNPKNPADTRPQEGKPGEGEPKKGDPKQGESGKGESRKGNEGSPQDGQPSDGQPSETQPSEGQPSEGQPGQPGEGSSGEKKPSDQQTPGRDELEKARRAMEQAIQKLKKKQRHEASDDQDEALANLQKAKEKLEEILRQLREEERERFLAMLEARFQKMLTMQLLVYDGTQKNARMTDSDHSSRKTARALQLARQEDEIAIEASKAILLLREEGSAVAFPEAVEQVRDDMRIVESRLERTDVAELTQGIEREIIEALEEMIEALQKEMEKSKEKKEQAQQKDGQPQDPPLVDQLAELKMLRTLQLRINHRTKRLGRLVEGEQAEESDIVNQLQNLADRQARIQKATHDLATEKNK